MNANQILRHHFERKKRQGYSLRALARDLDVSAAFISNVFSEKKKVPMTLIGPLARILDIDPETVMEVRRLLLSPDPLAQTVFKSPTASNRFIVGNKRNLSALRQWFYLPIMELVGCADFDGTMTYLQRRLGLSLTSVEVAVRELTALNMLEISGEGRLSKTTEFLRLTSSQSIQEIRTFHRQMLKKADEELSNPSASAFERRLITGITCSAPAEKIAIAKKMLADSLHEIASFLGEGSGDEVYHLSAQLFPLTKSK